MSHLLDFTSRLKTFCVAENAVCPKCLQSTNMHVFENYDSAIVLAFPVGKFGTNYFALCPSCNSTFMLTDSEAEKIKSGDIEVFKNLEALKKEESNV